MRINQMKIGAMSIMKMSMDSTSKATGAKPCTMNFSMNLYAFLYVVPHEAKQN